MGQERRTDDRSEEGAGELADVVDPGVGGEVVVGNGRAKGAGGVDSFVRRPSAPEGEGEREPQLTCSGEADRREVSDEEGQSDTARG